VLKCLVTREICRFGIGVVPFLRLRRPALYHYIKKSRISDKIFAAKERKEHRDNDLCSLFFVIFVFFCGNSLFGCGGPRWGNIRFLLQAGAESCCMGAEKH